MDTPQSCQYRGSTGLLSAAGSKIETVEINQVVYITEYPLMRHNMMRTGGHDCCFHVIQIKVEL